MAARKSGYTLRRLPFSLRRRVKFGFKLEHRSYSVFVDRDFVLIPQYIDQALLNQTKLTTSHLGLYG